MKVKISGDSAQSIYDSVRALCSASTLQAGDMLPPVRELAQLLGVNRNTVSAAYKKLTSSGIAVSQGRLGTRISQGLQAGEQEGSTDTNLFDLADGSPRKDWLPNLNEVVRQTQLNQYLYGEATMLPSIHEYACQWFSSVLHRSFDVTLCNGAIDTLERMLTAHLIPGDIVVVEDPCYISSANAIRLAGMQVVGAAVDTEGMQPDALRTALSKGAKAVLITPRAHNPTGVSISARRAAQLRAVLADFPGVVVMEDDHFALMAVTEHYSVIPDTTHNWAIFRSVSKGLGPDLRMAFVAADAESVKRINTRLAPGMSWVSRVLQSLVHTCLTSGFFKQQLTAAKVDCESRRTLLIKALLDNGVAKPAAVDGLNVWIYVDDDCNAIAYQLSRKGWLVRPGKVFEINQHSNALRVSIPNLDELTAQKFAVDLASI